jgi:hypothetical protein
VTVALFWEVLSGVALICGGVYFGKAYLKLLASDGERLDRVINVVGCMMMIVAGLYLLNLAGGVDPTGKTTR